MHPFLSRSGEKQTTGTKYRWFCHAYMCMYVCMYVVLLQMQNEVRRETLFQDTQPEGARREGGALTLKVRLSTTYKRRADGALHKLTNSDRTVTIPPPLSPACGREKKKISKIRKVFRLLFSRLRCSQGFDAQSAAFDHAVSAELQAVRVNVDARKGLLRIHTARGDTGLKVGG